MMPQQLLVQQFHEAFAVESPDEPTMPNIEIRKLRAKLILEEALELIDKGLGIHLRHAERALHVENIAFIEGIPDFSELKDGMADLEYVNLGTAVSCGVDLEPVFNEVHRSNMSKLWTDDELKTMPSNCMVAHSLAQCEIPIRRHVVKRIDGKVIKSPSYSPANL